MCVALVSTGMSVPERIVTNQDTVEIHAQHGTLTPSGNPPTAEGIEKLVGIRERHFLEDDEDITEHAFIACDEAIRKAGISWNDINVIRVGSSSPVSYYPATACRILSMASVTGIEAVDVLLACTSSIASIIDIYRALSVEPNYKYGLAVGAEACSRMINWDDINANLWGDGAGAILFEKVHTIGDVRNPGIICTHLDSKPEGVDQAESIGYGTKASYRKPESHGIYPNVFFNGPEVQKFVIQTIIDSIPLTIEKANQVFRTQHEPLITIDDVDLFVIHQANGRAPDRPAKVLGIPREKFFMNVDRYGNTSSASILIALDEAIETGRAKKGDLVLLIGFGAGLTSGTVLLRL